MKKFLLLGLCLGALQLFANVNFWSSQQYRLSEPSGIRKIIPLVANKVVLDDVAFRTFQQQIPSEASGEFILMDMPMPDGNMRTFKVFERTCMASELAAKYPMIKTYQGIAMDNPAITAKFDYTLFGFHAMVFDEKGVYFIDPYTNQNTGLYNCYWKKDYVRQDGNYSSCQNDEHTINADYAQHLQQTQSRLADPTTTAIISDNKIRTFRLALACTIEYSAAVAGPSPTKPLVLSAMVTSINRVNGVFEKDLSIHMNLVPNNDTLIFITSDSYTNNNGGTMLGQNVTVCNARIGSANYDIGHVFSTGGGGVAYLGCICTADKARGVTGSSNPVGDGYDIDYVAHEMGHQYGADHTFNSITGSCSGNRASNAAYEPGSATTIMGYAGICGSDNIQPHSDDYFHRISISQIFTYISSTSCAVITTNGNTAPVVNTYTATYYVPYKTSFEFATSATDANGDPLTYCWEEWDLGGAAAWNATTAT
ncbi:MAG TPA: M12 family metallo-peptidase, partial [Chitinophagales bacterium]|nr:M12 family metallo-peptidase [Chitinophagales bacterium]